MWEILNFKKFEYFNWIFFIFKFLYLDKKIKIMTMKENEYKEKKIYMIGVFQKRRILMRY